MKQEISLRQLLFLAICVAMSLVTKRLISPVTNLLTDLLRIPGGSAATAFSLTFLIVGTAGLRWRWAATTAALVQSLVALSLGTSVYQGATALLTYIAPGFLIDLGRIVFLNRDKAYFILTCTAANVSGAVLSNLLVFHLDGTAYLLWLLIAALMGSYAGFLGEFLWSKLASISECRMIVMRQKNKEQ